MKINCLLLLFLWMHFSPCAQHPANQGLSTDSTQPVTYLFPRFIEGSVLQKTGAIEKALLNYDTDNQSVIFKQQGQNLVLTGLENVDTVYIGDKRFVPSEDKFYLVVTRTPVALLISYTYKPLPLEAQTDHNGTSRQNSNEVSNNISGAYLNRRFQGQYDIVFVPQFWLRRGHTFYKANNEKQVVHVFPGKADAIREFVSNRHMRFDKEEDMAKLIRFCSDQP